ncbi:MAG: hypothetical protein ACE5J9_03655, partial [Methanosarcinales archaeon]
MLNKFTDSTVINITTGSYNTSIPKITKISYPYTRITKADYSGTTIYIEVDTLRPTNLSINYVNHPFYYPSISTTIYPSSIRGNHMVSGSYSTFSNLTLIPSRYSIEVSNLSVNKDTYRWKEYSDNSNFTTYYTLKVQYPKASYIISYANDTLIQNINKTSNASSYITWSYSGGYYPHSVKVEAIKTLKGDFNGNEIIDIGDATYVAYM